MASEDGHIDGHSRECGTQWCKSLGRLGRPDVLGLGPWAGAGQGAIVAERQAVAPAATPAPHGLAQPGDAPSRARWSKGAGGCPEPQGQPIQELTIGGSRADQHRRHWNRRSRTGISRPLGAGTGVVGLIEIPRGSPARRGAGPGVRTDRRCHSVRRHCSRSVPSAARRRQSVRHCGAGDRGRCVSGCLRCSQSRFPLFRKEEVIRQGVVRLISHGRGQNKSRHLPNRRGKTAAAGGGKCKPVQRQLGTAEKSE